jgi:hypothetical protein
MRQTVTLYVHCLYCLVVLQLLIGLKFEILKVYMFCVLLFVFFNLSLGKCYVSFSSLGLDFSCFSVFTASIDVKIRLFPHKLYKIKFFYMFRGQSSHHQEVNDVNCTYAASGIVTLCK